MRPDIDLAELQSIIPDCVGWIRMDGRPINYPVVERFDHGYCLMHDFSREEPTHGQVSPASKESYPHEMRIGIFRKLISTRKGKR